VGAAAGGSVGAAVGAAAPPQAVRIMLKTTSNPSRENILRIFLLLTKFERFTEI
jgi:hypothetical protein